MRNKTHKQRFSSKRAVARRESAGGRATEKKKVFAIPQRSSTSSHKGGNDAGNKDKARQAAEARRKMNATEVAKEKSIGSRGGPPRIVSFIPVNESASSHATRDFLFRACGTEPPVVSTPVTVRSTRHRFTTILCDDLHEQRILDAVKVSDIVVLALDCSTAAQETIKSINGGQAQLEEDDGLSQYSGSTWFNDIGLCITDATRELIHAVNSHGCPTTVVVLQGLTSYVDDRRRRHTIRIHERYFHSVFSKDTRVMTLDSEGDASEFVRCLANIKLKQLQWREMRPYLLVDYVAYNDESGELEVRGYLRGNNASASMLFHVTNFNTYKCARIAAPGDPCALLQSGAEVCGNLDDCDSEIQESLTGVQQNETALPEEEFVTEADVALAQHTHTVWVPEGVSEYQAAWYDHDPEAPAEVKMQPRNEFDSASKRSGQSDAVLLRAEDVLRHERLTDEERVAERQRLLDECEDEERHADEIDTPIDVPARQRFAKYRAMKSFSTSAWDPKESLPLEYSRIFELNGYGRIRDDSVAELQQCPVLCGTYVSIVLRDVPATVANADLLIVSGQLRHEQKWSVIHCHVQRSSEYADPIKSKTTMLAHIGFRKFFCEPIFSDAVVGNRSKFARYFLPGEKFRIATFYAPISFHPCPVMMYEAPAADELKERPELRLALFGSVLPPNPDFLILKRVVLTGRIATIYKKVLVVKYMFFNEDDVKWFMPVDLFTRLGRQGRIIKAVGTHGLFKASFNDTVFQHDTICMSLYKRVFPKWRTVPYDEAGEMDDSDGDDDVMDN